MKLFIVYFFILFSSLYADEKKYSDKELECIATYELSKDFFMALKDKASIKLVTDLQELLKSKYEEGHFPQENIDQKIFELHLQWSEEFDFLPVILENCVQNIR
jgi:hypothetical protein